MTQDAHGLSDKISDTTRNGENKKADQRRWFSTPQPIKRLFDTFPLVTYASNELPQRTAKNRGQHTLYIFTSEDGAKKGVPSFNPGCLKWQAYLRFQHISLVTTPSNNHASPSGALPFLLPAASSSSTSFKSATISSNRILRWTRDVIEPKKKDTAGLEPVEHHEHMDVGARKSTSPSDVTSDMRYEAYMALLDHRIRSAYLYSIYLSPSNFASIAQPLYINPTSSNVLVRFTLSRQLRAAAESELLKQSTVIDVESIYRGSDKAFAALSELLGEHEYFFSKVEPGLFDASVFAYTNILLDEELGWKDRRMREGLRECQNLVAHRRRILKTYF